MHGTCLCCTEQTRFRSEPQYLGAPQPAGPVLGAMGNLQGFLSAALVVSSFHVLDKLGGEDGPERVVRILYGEGDRYGCWVDIPA